MAGQQIALSPTLASLLTDLAQGLQVPSFILFGGAALDLTCKPDGQVHDVDIAIHNSHALAEVRAALSEHGYTVTVPLRRYYINTVEEVHICCVAKAGITYDINFLSSFNTIGQFDLETIHCRYPQLDVQDHHASLRALEQKTLRLLREIGQENPYLVLARLLVLSAKYQLPLVGNPRHSSYIQQLNRQLAGWRSGTVFHDREAPAVLCSALLRSILRSNDRLAYLAELGGSGILSVALPELHSLFQACEQLDQPALASASAKMDLVQLFTTALTPALRRQLFEHLTLFELRWWSQNDQQIGRYAYQQIASL